MFLKKVSKDKTVLVVLMAITFIVCCVLLIRLLVDGYVFWAKGETSYEITGQVGDFIGGIIGTLFSFAAFYMMYRTLEEQRREHNEEKLEDRFFSLLEYHRQNVERMSFDATLYQPNTDTTSLNAVEYHGNQVFNAIWNQFISCRNELKTFFPDVSAIYEDSYLDEIKKLFPDKQFDDFFKHLSVVDICYCIVLYGVTSQGKSILRNIFKEKYKRPFIEDILGYIALKPASDASVDAQWRQLSSINDCRRKKELVPAIKRFRNNQDYKGSYMKQSDYDLAKQYGKAFAVYYGGHQFLLGHYFRHLFQTVSFINNQENIPFSEKYRYIKILRAQLSDYEQMVLFLNSLSQVGRKWEICSSPSIKGDLIQNKLITRYHLIKNIPRGSLYDLQPEYYYPNVEYEFRELG